MTNVAYARRKDVDPVGAAPTTAGEVGRSKGDRAATQSTATSAASAITTYIPTEILTLYVAVIAAVGPGGAGTTGSSTAWGSFLAFLVITPIVVWLVYAGKVRTAKKPLPVRLGQWPKWEMAAATIAFVAWAFALPATPFAALAWYNAALAGIAVLVVSTLIGLVAPIVAQPLDG
jgi:hypothetical protein